MKPDVFMDDFGRTIYGDDLYSIIGRALTVSTRFEAMCKMLNTMFHVKSKHGILESEEQISVLVNKIRSSPLARHIKEIAKVNKNAIGFDGLRDLLDAARIARNEIAHEITLGLDMCIDSIEEDKITDLKIELEKSIKSIAQADKIISLIVSIVTHEPIPSGDFLESYPDRLKSWVIDIDE